MEIFAVLFILASVQALAEFLPVSSSGHLVLVEHLPWIEENMRAIGEGLLLFINVMLHVATLIAVVIYLRRDIVYLAKGAWSSIVHREMSSPDLRTVMYIIIASVPAGVIGVLFNHQIESFFSSPKLVAEMLIANGLVLLSTRYVKIGQRFIAEAGIVRVIIIGLCQAIAIVPGISRSGLTITGGFFMGLEPVEAAKFSFLMAIPVIAGAGLLEGIKIAKGGLPDGLLVPLVLAMTVATLLALAALHLLMHFVRKIQIDVFGYYTIGVGIAGLVYFSL